MPDDRKISFFAPTPTEHFGPLPLEENSTHAYGALTKNKNVALCGMIYLHLSFCLDQARD